MTLKYNTRVIPRVFTLEGIIVKRENIGQRDTLGVKLIPNWEGPYRVIYHTEKCAYTLENNSGDTITQTWNATKLKLFVS